MSVVSMKQLLEAGVHFGHQTRRWNPKMAEYIYCERNGIYIIDLQKTVKKLEEAYDFVRQLAENGQTILFVGTKKQATDAVKEEASRVGMYYVNARWLGGMLTNFKTMRTRVDRLAQLKKMQEDGTFDMLPKKEVMKHLGEMEKLEKYLGGVKDMNCYSAVDVDGILDGLTEEKTQSFLQMLTGAAAALAVLLAGCAGGIFAPAADLGGEPLLCALLGLAVTGLTVLPAMAGTPKPTKTE